MEVNETPSLFALSKSRLSAYIVRYPPLSCPRLSANLPQAIDPPPELSLRNAVQLLQSLGALDDEEELTDLGARLAGISIDPR